MQTSDPLEQSTRQLLASVREGDERAREIIVERYRSRLRRWARSRIPPHARGMIDTEDVVQDTLRKTLHHLSTFAPEHSGSFRAFMRRALKHQLVDQIRAAERRPASNESDSRILDRRPSPLEIAMSAEKIDRFERALDKLDIDKQSLIISRFEDGLSFSTIAQEHGKSSPDAARMAVKRAIEELIREMANRD